MSYLLDKKSGPKENAIKSQDEQFRILLVEDQMKHQLVYREALSAALPVEVTGSATVADAIALIFKDPAPDLLILDLELPDGRGDDILRRVRHDHRLSHVPVIIFTGLATTEKQLELLDLGADDFIEKGAPPEIVIARVKAQMRHKLALDRLTRLALDRDLFAAGVLKDISGIRNTVTSLTTQARSMLIAQQQDPTLNHRQELDACYQALSASASRLGAYAADVIQSVRESRRTPKLEPLAIMPLVDWVLQLLASGDKSSPARPRIQVHGELGKVIADESFLRLALLNIIQYAQKKAIPGHDVVIEISQTPVPNPNAIERPLLRTTLRDHGKSPSETQLSHLFQPYIQDQGADSEHVEDDDLNSDMGFGLGLSLVAKVIAMMGGNVDAALPTVAIDSANEKGTAIWFDLPSPL